MSIADFPIGSGASDAAHTPVPLPQERRLHRLASVRRREGISRRTIARKMNVDVGVVRRQEEETSDMPLSVLYQWQALLDVPTAELLVDPDESLSASVMERARMIRIMKSVLTILERSNQPSVRRMAQNVVELLLELMPELKSVSAWQAVGQRRRLDEYGRAAERPVAHDTFFWSMH